MSTATTWVIERDVFSSSDDEFAAAIESCGGRVVLWDDAWWMNSGWPKLNDGPVVYRGCLANAARVAEEVDWKPGAFCNTAEFNCTAWYPDAASWLLNKQWVRATVESLVASPDEALREIGSPGKFFVRPDSPLKPFSGRVLESNNLTLKALDHGYYYDDASIPVIAAPVVTVDKEWRYVVVKGEVVAGSAYEADGRTAKSDDPSGEPWAYAQSVAQSLSAPEPVYVLDVCMSGGQLHLLELNPFSGADLYACDPKAVIEAVSKVAQDG